MNFTSLADGRFSNTALARWIQHHPDYFAGTLLLILALLLMAPYLAQPEVQMMPRAKLPTDFFNYRWTMIVALRESLAEHGQFPLWYSATMSGQPIVGNPAVMLFYPPHLILALMPISIFWSASLLAALHLWLAGIGGYALAHRAVGVQKLPAFVAATVIMLLPRLSANLVGDIGLAYSMCWVPICLAWSKVAVDRRDWRFALLAGLGLGMQFITHVHIFYYTSFVAGVYFLYHSAVEILASRGQMGAGGAAARFAGDTLRMILIAAVSAGVAAINLLPFVSYLPYLSRHSMSLAEANLYALPAFMLTHVALPSALKFWEWEFYAGLLAVITLPMAWLHPRRRETIFWMGLALFSILFALGNATPLHGFMHSVVPGFTLLRVPPRMLLFFDISLAVLLGLALGALDNEQVLRRITGVGWQRWFLIGGGTLVIMTIAGRYFTRRAGELDWLLGLSASLGLILALVVIWRRSLLQLSRATMLVVLAVVVVVDLFPVSAAMMQPVNANLMLRTHPVLEFYDTPDVRTQQPFRLYEPIEAHDAHLIASQDLETISGLNSFQFGNLVELIKLATSCTNYGVSPVLPDCPEIEVQPGDTLPLDLNSRLLGLLNVRYINSAMPPSGDGWIERADIEGRTVYENADALPRVFAVGRIEQVDEDTLWARMQEIDPAEIVLITEPLDDVTTLPSARFMATPNSLVITPNSIEVDISMPDDGMLVLSEVWTPGWSATDNDEPVTVLRADGALRGVYLTSGEHHVRLQFIPPLFLIGLTISAATVIGIGAALGLVSRSSRRSKPSLPVATAGGES